MNSPNMQVETLEALTEEYKHNRVYAKETLARLIRAIFDAMEPELENLVYHAMGITKTWDLELVRSTGVCIVYAALDMLCHLTSTEAKMGLMCVEIIQEQCMMSLVHHAHHVVQSLHVWCLFQPVDVGATTSFYKNRDKYQQLSQIGQA